jgi:hypothetical protein
MGSPAGSVLLKRNRWQLRLRYLYITANEAFIPNYDDRYRYGEVISTAFVESTVNGGFCITPQKVQ